MGCAKGWIVEPRPFRTLADGADQNRKKNRQWKESPRKHPRGGLAHDYGECSTVCSRQ